MLRNLVRAIFVLLVLTVYVNQALACSNFFSDKRGGFPPTYVKGYTGRSARNVNKFNSSGDPLLKTVGDAKVTHPKEFKAIIDDLHKHGVDIVIRDGESLAFSPASSGGLQGCRIILPKEFSISALRHEYGHFLDHKALGYPPFRAYMQQPELRLASERRQYLHELRFAKEFNDPQARKALAENYLAEKDYIVSNFYTREYGKINLNTSINLNGGK